MLPRVAFVNLECTSGAGAGERMRCFARFPPHPALWLSAFARLDRPFLVQSSNTIKGSTAVPALRCLTLGGY